MIFFKFPINLQQRPCIHDPCFFLSTQIKSLTTHLSVSLSSAGFPYEIRLHGSQKFNIVAAILNSIQQPGCVFVTPFHPRNLVHIASDKPLNYHPRLWLLLCPDIHTYIHTFYLLSIKITIVTCPRIAELI